MSEVFHLNHQNEAEALLKGLEGPAAIGHVRYATCGKNDRNYAQPFERHHLEKRKCFAFGFNGQLANYQKLVGKSWLREIFTSVAKPTRKSCCI